MLPCANFLRISTANRFPLPCAGSLVLSSSASLQCHCYCRAMREVVIVGLAAFLIGIMVAALLAHFLPLVRQAAMTARRFPPPWSVEKQETCFAVRDHNGQQLAYVYFEDGPDRRSAAKFAYTRMKHEGLDGKRLHLFRRRRSTRRHPLWQLKACVLTISQTGPPTIFSRRS
jgi:hypothetical protein